MNGFAEFMIYALIAVFSQNMLISGASGLTSVLYAAGRPKRLAAMSALVSAFAMLGSAVILPFDLFFPVETSYMPFHGLILSASVLIWYVIAAKIVVRIEKIRDRIGPLLAPAAINGVVLGMPLAANFNGVGDATRLLGLALGTGGGFALASVLIAGGLRRCDNPDLPRALRGVPIMLIYIGLLSLGFMAFGGGMELI